ncbi:hypothetical protein ACFE04_027197 [Oxalis oulophora]
MDDNDGLEVRKWEDLDTDILIKIFKSFDIFEITSGVARVCSAWRTAACDPMIWNTLDLSLMKSNFIKIPLEPHVYVDCRSDKTLTRVLKLCLSLSHGCINTMIFHFNLYVSDDHLTYTAERTPQLKRLVLPAWNRIKKTGMCKAIQCWKNLESLTMASIANPSHFMQEISYNCTNLRELKVMGPVDHAFAATLSSYVPELKVLSVRCTTLLREVLIFLLDEIRNLEVLNISHCLLIDVPPPPAPKKLMKQLDQTILQKASRLRKFLTCIDDSCIMCQRTRTDEGFMRWYKYEENIWKNDELPETLSTMQLELQVLLPWQRLKLRFADVNIIPSSDFEEVVILSVCAHIRISAGFKSKLD